jgi:hypothetical protein
MCCHKSFVSICANIGPKGCKLTSQVDGYFFLPWAQIKALKWYIKKIVFLALTTSVKPLVLVLMIAPIGMFDLSSTLALTTNVKWA